MLHRATLDKATLDYARRLPLVAAAICALWALSFFRVNIVLASARPWTASGSLMAYRAPDPIDKEVTVRTVMRISEGAEQEDLASIHLVGLGARDTGLPDQLSLVWYPDQSAFWFSWRLQVRTGAQIYDLDQTSGPLPGHTYETVLSYDQVTGSLALLVTDTTDDTVLCRRGLVMPASEALVYAGASVALADSAQDGVDAVVLEEMVVSAGYLPIAYQWELFSLSPDGEEYPAWLFDMDEKLVIQLDVPARRPRGAFSFHLEHATGWRDLGQVAADNKARIVIPAAALPIGSSRLHVRYTENGRTLLSDVEEIMVGALEATADPVAFDRSTQAITGTITLQSRGAMNVDFMLEATVTRLVWSADERDYVRMPTTTHVLIDQPLAIQSGDTVLPVSIPLPQEQGVWHVDYKVSLNPEPRLTTYRMQQYVSSYLPADIAPGQPYTIAIMPDTQAYTTNYPEVFMRQTEWLAAHAQQLNLGMVLHVGDITETNTPEQWQHAYNAIHLLDGVAPYVLTIGAGHDFSSSRETTLFNNYFTVNNAKRNSNLGGTYKEGRLEDSYSLFTLGGEKYLVIALNSGPSDGAVEWANELAARFPDHKVIVVTHMLMAKQGTLMDDTDVDQWPPGAYSFSRRPGESVNNGKQLWEKLLSRHPNILMSWSGHVGVAGITRRIDVGEHGNPVYNMMADYQNHPHGGDGWIVLMTFNPNDTVDVRAYSTYLKEYKRDIDRFGFNCSFTIDLSSGRFAPTQMSPLLDNLR